LTPPEIGLMQLCGKTAGAFNVRGLIEDPEYNFDCGAATLSEKWAEFVGRVLPAYFCGLPTELHRGILENWWYPMKLYNSTWKARAWTYPEYVYHRIYCPRISISPYVIPLSVTKPSQAIPGYKYPGLGDSRAAYFRVSPSGEWLDGYGAIHIAPAHFENFGDAGFRQLTSVVKIGRALRTTAILLSRRIGHR